MDTNTDEQRRLVRLLDTLPERLALARSNRLPHHDFLEMLLTDEVARRDRQSAARRAKAAHLDPQMQLHAWDDSLAIIYDQQLWAELTSLRFLADAYNVLIMGPVGVGKTFLANALGHIAVRRHHSVHTERADKLLTPARRTPGRHLRRRDAHCSSSTTSRCTGSRPPKPATSTS
jgi:DNA replication protein DnaC